MTTSIAWTNETWNPTTGCSRVSEGCRHCYAERLSLKYGWSQKPWTNQNAAENVKLHPDRLDKPMTWKGPRLIFVNSMSDLFHEQIPDEFIQQVFDVMAVCHWHTFQVLTKRPERALGWIYPRNVWIGTSVEDGRVVQRIDRLRTAPASVRFISFEPLIGPVGEVDLSGYQWAIVGGESGPNFRPMDMQWARDIRDQCADQGLAFFFKQDASKAPGTRPYLVEEDGTRAVYQQYPGDRAFKPAVRTGPAQLSLPMQEE